MRHALPYPIPLKPAFPWRRRISSKNITAIALFRWNAPAPWRRTSSKKYPFTIGVQFAMKDEMIFLPPSKTGKPFLIFLSVLKPA